MFAGVVHFLFHEWGPWNYPIGGYQARVCRQCHRYQRRKSEL